MSLINSPPGDYGSIVILLRNATVVGGKMVPFTVSALIESNQSMEITYQYDRVE